MKVRSCYLSNSVELAKVPKVKHNNVTSYSKLKELAWDSCDICDKLFSNKFDLLQHNLSHIIIPLIKQNTYECIECLHHFTSQEDLSSHSLVKHNKLFDHSFIKTKKDNTHILESIVEKDILVKCEDDIKNFNKIIIGSKSNAIEEFCECCQTAFSSKEDLETHKIENHYNLVEFKEDYDEYVLPDKLHEIVAKDVLVKCEDDFRNIEHHIDDPTYGHVKEELVNEPLRNRLRFEDDDDDEELQPNIVNNVDQTYSSQVGMENLCEDKPSDNSAMKFKSVHYDKLIKPDVCYCPLCEKEFPNRYKLIEHQAKHMRLRPFRPVLCCVCERFIAGNYRTLRTHMQKHHPYQLDKHFKTSTCELCKLKYHNYFTHLSLYHNIYRCVRCLTDFKSQTEKCFHSCGLFKNKHGSEIEKSSMLKLCETCLLFMKNKQNLSYEVKGVLNRIGSREICEKCNNRFFELKLVQRVQVFKESQSLLGRTWKQKKCLSNTERLKKMQNRLKSIMKMNKL